METKHNPYRNSRLADIAALFIVLTFLLSGWMTLSYYGISWDEGLGNFFFGNRYAQYILSGFDTKFLDFTQNFGDPPGELSLEAYSPYREKFFEFPGLVDTLSGLSMRFFSYQLNLLDPVDAFHAVTVLIAAIFLWGQYYYVSRLFDQRIALLSILFLATAPRFWGDAHFNPKDVPETAAFSLTILSFMAWIQKPTFKQATLTGIFFGVAMAVKANAVFVPIIILLWILSWVIQPSKFKTNILEVIHHWPQLSWMFFVFGSVYWLSWPLLYTSPSLSLLYFQYIFSQGGRLGKGEWSLQPLKMVFAGNLEVFVFFLTIGIVFLIILFLRNQHFKIRWMMVLLWLCVPILRISAPISVNFDGFRHFLEYLPAASLIAGFGVISIIEVLKKFNHFHPKFVSSLIVLLILVNTGFSFAHYFPYQYIYFNQFVGGLQGAHRFFKQGEVTDYWAVSYREGIGWLNNHAGQNALLDVPVGDYLVNIPANLWLREDIKLISDNQVAEYRGTDREVYIMNITRPSFFKQVAQSCYNQPAVFEEQVDEVTILTIHRLQDCLGE